MAGRLSARHSGVLLAPCAAGCNRREYYHQVDRAVAFLDGTDRQVLQRLESAMREASERRDFERAIGHRDALQELSYFFDQLQLLRDVARDYWFVYPVAPPGLPLWNLIAGGDVVAVAAEPATTSGRKALAHFWSRPSWSGTGRSRFRLRNSIESTVLLPGSCSVPKKGRRSCRPKTQSHGAVRDVHVQDHPSPLRLTPSRYRRTWP